MVSASATTPLLPVMQHNDSTRVHFAPDVDGIEQGPVDVSVPRPHRTQCNHVAMLAGNLDEHDAEEPLQSASTAAFLMHRAGSVQVIP